ncbi:hypothetical protein AOQ84DRAFT_50823 [Glonium stellatum]|uniref:Uncharacterized protein n=1 Tax=Glonium stellatum TaxID=574774 RepID=A0A8E2EZR1_9PEZI|nr:hypothetical protein AOQ84DRAFT_50823 [Glonium stellatum]
MSGKVEGVAAQEVQPEYIPARIFDAEKEDRKIAFKGALIRISDPNAGKGTEDLVDLRDITQYEYYTVPAGFELEVIDGWVKLTKSSAS